jgi:hypothetical protein
MSKAEFKEKLRRGRKITVRRDVVEWRKRMKRWRRLKSEILALLASSGKSSEEIKAWFDTPHRDLDDRTPRALFNPKAVAVLHIVVRKLFDNCRRVA